MCKRKKYRLILIIFVTTLVILAGCILLKIIKLNTLWAKNYPVQGIDVSHYQGDIDWQKIQNQGIHFAFIKATDGSSSVDEKFAENWTEATGTTLKIGAYHFFSFDSAGKTQAENYIKTVGSLEEKLVPVIDVEYYGDKATNPPHKEAVISELTDMLQLLEQEYGAKPIIYTTHQVYYKYLEEEFTEYPLWIRDVYLYPITLKDQWIFWQYSDTAVLDGYKGVEKYIDRNVFYGNAEELNQFVLPATVSPKNTASDEKIIEAILPEADKYIYENFLKLEYADLEYLYTYHDFDGNGIQELCIKKENIYGVQSGYIIRCHAEGLHFFYQSQISEAYFDELDWFRTAELSKTIKTGEMTHSGIYVYTAQNEYGETTQWYPDEQSFLNSFDLVDSKPFYEYYNEDGSKRLSFYYNEQTKEGCGIRYYERDPTTFSTGGMYGFTFQGLNVIHWNATINDYFSLRSFDSDTGINYVNDYKTNIEYDDKGNVIHFDSSGIFTELSDEETKPQYILWMDYEYHENGNLQRRAYWHNPYIFGTGYTTWNSYFDEQGRVTYEDIYVTHGSLDHYYIYSNDTNKPTYLLILDNNTGSWIPELIQYD